MGHPIVNSAIAHANGNAFRFRHVIGMEQPTCGIFFGSRASELKYHTNIFLDIAQKIQEQIPDIIFIAPTLPKFKDQIAHEFRARGLKAIIPSDKAEKDEAIAACNVALNVSGTIGLELSIANVPHVMAYKFQKLSYFIAKLMIKTKYGHLTNIIMNDDIVPEFLQDDIDAEIIANRLINLLNTPHIRQKQIQAFQIVKDRLTPQNAQKNSANKAAEFILSFLK